MCEAAWSLPASPSCRSTTADRKEQKVNPEQLLFSKTHEWVHVDQDASGNKVITMGITAFALEALTDLVFVELPEVGREVSSGEAIGEIESVKAVSDLYSPVDGKVVEVHSALADSLDTLSDDPYNEGWFVRIEVSDDSGLGDLLDYSAYQKQCAEEMAED
jgi:glycine cleavage system H protein